MRFPTRLRNQNLRQDRHVSSAPGQINKTLTRLSQIPEEAVEYELIDRNPRVAQAARLKAASLSALGSSPNSSRP